MSEELSDYVAEHRLVRPSGVHHTLRLQDQVKNTKLWPTIRGQDSYERSNWKTINKVNEEGGDLTLTRKVKYQAKEDGIKGQLNPDWVAWLMGWPIGWESLQPFKWGNWPSDDWWSVDPADTGTIPRVATGIPNRVDRLKALGNGQVPLCVKVAWEILTKEVI